MADTGESSPTNGGSGEPSPHRDDGTQADVLSLSQLIGAPIQALVDAEAHSAMATARFIRSVGFTRPDDAAPGDLGDLQMARFKQTRRAADGSEEEYMVEVPLLTLLPIPALQIRDAVLDYVVRVVQTETLPQQRAEMVRNLQVPAHAAFDPPATLRATFARDAGIGRRSVDMQLKMKVRVEQADLPAGLAKLLNLATESVSRSRIEPEQRLPGGNGEDTGA